MSESSLPLDSRVRIGHVHLKVANLERARIPLDGASDHGVSEALYLRDPDGNGIELYWDRPREEWPHTAEGELTMFTRPLLIGPE